MSMGRPRKDKKDLPPWLYCYHGRNCYIRVGDALPVDLGTKDKAEALAIYWEFRKKWDAERTEKRASRTAIRLEMAVKGTDRLTIADYAADWRQTKLPTLLKRNGNPLSDKTRADYARMLANQVEKHEPFKNLLLATCSTRDLRQFLAAWIHSPNYYNYMKSLLSRLLKHAVDEGLMDGNPVETVDRRAVAKRGVYLTDAHYTAIISGLAEWEARACDLLYLVSHRPMDVLGLKENQINENEITFTAAKNDQDMVIEMNDDLREVVAWFRTRKTAQGIVSPYLVCYPTTSRRRSIGKRVSVEYLSRRFSAAVAAAGLEDYTLRDIRPKGLTDDFLLAGDSDKGGHKTEAMKRHYRRVRLPMRAKNNLRRLRD